MNERKTIYQLKPDIINRIKYLISAKPVRMSTLTVNALRNAKTAEPVIQNNVVDTANVSIGVTKPTMAAPVAPVEATRPMETITQAEPALQSPVIPVGLNTLPNGIEPLNSTVPTVEPQLVIGATPIQTYNYQELSSMQMNPVVNNNIPTMDDAGQSLDTPKEVMETSIKNGNEEKEKLTMDELLKEMVEAIVNDKISEIKEAVNAEIESLNQKIEKLETKPNQNLGEIKQAVVDATNRFGQAIQPDFSQAQREPNIPYQRAA